MTKRNPDTNGGKNEDSLGVSSLTSQDVARLANVSRATVSYVLNNTPNARISESTRKRVLWAAAELGYVPHELASSLRAGRNDLVLLPFFDWPYNPNSIAFLRELATQLDQLGYSVLLRFFSQDDKNSLARKIAAFHPAGIIVVSEEFTRADVDLLSRNGVYAILAYGWLPDAIIPSVSVDFTQVGKCAADYLIGKGHRHIAAIVPHDSRINQLGLQRLAGLEEAARPHGVRIERVDLNYDSAEAADLARKWQQGSRPTAVFTYNDEYGMLLMSALQDIGLSVPADIALVGCDNLPLCELLRPRLTSIALPSSSLATEIAIYFDQMIRGESQERMLSIPVSSDIIVRESS